MLGAAVGMLEKGRGKREDGSSRIKGLLFPVWDTTLGAGRGRWALSSALFGRSRGPLLLFQGCALPPPHPGWARRHSVCHFDARGRTRML